MMINYFGCTWKNKDHKTEVSSVCRSTYGLTKRITERLAGSIPDSIEFCGR